MDSNYLRPIHIHQNMKIIVINVPILDKAKKIYKYILQKLKNTINLLMKKMFMIMKQKKKKNPIKKYYL